MGNSIRVAVFGPAKAGKTTLAARMNKNFVSGEYIGSSNNVNQRLRWEEQKLNLKVMQGSRSWDWEFDKGTRGVIFMVDCGLDATDTKEWEHTAACLKIALSKIKSGPVLVLANKWDLADERLTLADVKRLIEYDTAIDTQFKSPNVHIEIFESGTLSDKGYQLADGLKWFITKLQSA